MDSSVIVALLALLGTIVGTGGGIVVSARLTNYQGAAKGVFITTTRFSKDAVAFAQKQLHSKIVLIDGKQLTKLMIEYELGVSTTAIYKVKRVDTDFFIEDV